MGLRLRWGGGGERAPWLGTGRVGARVTAASGCAVPGRHGLGAQHQLPPASMWLGAAQEQTSRGQHPQRAQALPSPWCHQLLLAGSLVPTDEPWPGSTCPVLAARGASPPHPQPGGQRGAEALGRAVAVSALCCVQEVLDHCPGAACRAASPCASPHLLTSAPRMQRERRVCRSRIHHVLPRGLCCLQEGDSECLALRTAGG